MSSEPAFRRSSFCDTSACVEVAYIRSSHCSGGACVEVGHVGGEVLVRDSKDPDGAQLRFTAAEWAAFLAGARDGEFDV